MFGCRESSRARPVDAAVVATAALLAVLSGCAGEDAGAEDPAGEMTLTVLSEDWNGWDPDHETTPETVTLAVAVGESTTVESLGEDVELEVTDVDGDEVEVTTSSAMAPRDESGGLDLNSTEDTFVVTPDHEARFATPTTDAGITYTLTLEAGVEK